MNYIDYETAQEREVQGVKVTMRPMNWYARNQFEITMIDMGIFRAEQGKIVVGNDTDGEDSFDLMKKIAPHRRKLDSILADHIEKIDIGFDREVAVILPGLSEKLYSAVTIELYKISRITEDEVKN